MKKPTLSVIATLLCVSGMMACSGENSAAENTAPITNKAPATLNITPILVAVQTMGADTFEAKHNQSPNTLFMMQKSVIANLPEFRDIWLYDPKAQSATGPKPTTDILPQYFHLIEGPIDQVFIGRYRENADDTIFVDMETRTSDGQVMRVHSYSTAANLTPDNRNDILREILTMGFKGNIKD